MPASQQHSHYYPYPFIGQSTPDSVWAAPGVDVKQTLQSIEGPIVEIGGPTDIGHYWLDGVALSEKPHITNVAYDSQKAAPPNVRTKLKELTDYLVDGTHMPFDDNSVGIIIAAHLPIIDETGYDFGDFSANDAHQHNKTMDAAAANLSKAAATGDVSDTAIAPNLHLRIAKETYRALRPGGLYLIDINQEELQVLEYIGFTPIAYATTPSDWDDPPVRYYAVLQKSA